jgi:hypothetical protein
MLAPEGEGKIEQILFWTSVSSGNKGRKFQKSWDKVAASPVIAVSTAKLPSK